MQIDYKYLNKWKEWQSMPDGWTQKTITTDNTLPMTGPPINNINEADVEDKFRDIFFPKKNEKSVFGKIMEDAACKSDFIDLMKIVVREVIEEMVNDGKFKKVRKVRRNTNS